MRGTMDDITPETTLARMRRFFEIASERGMNIEDRAKELAEAIGVSQATVFRWRAGTSPLQSVKAFALAAGLDKLEKKYDMT